MTIKSNLIKEYNMNILKLVKCYWRQRISDGVYETIHYYVQYERGNYSGYAEIERFEEANSGIAKKHFDWVDNEICLNLKSLIKENSNVKDFKIDTDEIILIGQSEKLCRANFSSMAFGFDFSDLQINTINAVIVSLKTRIFFNSYEDESIKNIVEHSIPKLINIKDLKEKQLDLKKSIIKANFIPRDEVNKFFNHK